MIQLIADPAVFIFTFSPVQPFIEEARRASDLYAGSRILVRLAKAAAEAIQSLGGSLIYPAELSDDIPNKMVFELPFDQCQAAADAGRGALLAAWRELVDQSRDALRSKAPDPDPEWQQIWDRQTAPDYYWEIYSSAARLKEQSYSDASESAEKLLGAAKRTRVFVQAEEPGVKDSLSGRRQALRTKDLSALAFWKAVGEHIDASYLRPGGGERLDALGVVKRFGQAAKKEENTGKIEPNQFYGSGFPSTSSVASAPFLALARDHAPEELKRYRQALDGIHGLFHPRQDPDFPYDGDLLYLDTLVPKRLKDDYGVEVSEGSLAAARDPLKKLYKKLQSRPSPYYAILVLDGDNMGEHVGGCQSRDEHRELSKGLYRFSLQVKPILEELHTCRLNSDQGNGQHEVQYHGKVVFNGGDDVLALLPLAGALEAGRELAQIYREEVGSADKPARTASAGIAIAHHQSPLDAALRAARQAEHSAKELDAKDAVCVRVLKRSGEMLEMRSPWLRLNGRLYKAVKMFGGGNAPAEVSSRLAYDVNQVVYGLPAADDALEAELGRLIGRHKLLKNGSLVPTEWAEELRAWAASLPRQGDDLGQWLLLARFIAQGGVE